MLRHDLVVVMPVYNEQDAVNSVIALWDNALGSLGIDYRLRVYNDGSKDDSAPRLDALAGKFPRLEVYHKTNSGHGPTILAGYRMAGDCRWIFQVDSDDEMGPENFAQLWARRNRFDILLGRREGRTSPLARRIVTFVSRRIVRLFFGRGIHDVNTPYRLMRTDKFRALFSVIPDNTFAPNIAVSGYACLAGLRICELSVPHQPRSTGVVSIKKWRLLKAAVKSLWQTVFFRFSGISRGLA